MNLAWIAAVLEPLDVVTRDASHRVAETGGAGHLAAVVLGWNWLLPEEEDSSSKQNPVSIAQRCLQTDTIGVATAELAAMLMASRPEDEAKAVALSLIACSAASELEDFALIDNLLTAQLDWNSDTTTSDGLLLRAVLLQQRALRWCDVGTSYLATSEEAAASLVHVDPAACSTFLVPGTNGVATSTRTMRRIRESLASAIVSLVPIENRSSGHIAAIAGELGTGHRPSAITRAAEAGQRVYADYVAQTFRAMYGNKGYVVGGPTHPDLFHVALGLELVGHNSVYRARKELALLRLVQTENDVVQLSDTLRLLRHGGARNELEQALHRIRIAGPLAALSRDARQILRSRRAPELLRTVELRVLRASAELLAPAEARIGLDAARATLAAGGPASVPGIWQLKVSRDEQAWAASAALANSCDSVDEVAQMLLEIVEMERERPELFDHAMRSAIAELDWDRVSADVRIAWTSAMSSRPELPLIANALRSRLPGLTIDPAGAGADPLTTLTQVLNAALSGMEVDRSVLVSGGAVVLARLDSIRENASRGVSSFGGLSPAEVAVGLITVGVDNLWAPLVEFLLDPQIARSDRSDAFDRLARASVVIPSEVASAVRDRSMELILTPGRMWGESGVVPYPSALRFVGVYGLLNDAQVYDAIAALAGSRQQQSRREGAATTAIVASRRPAIPLLAFALTLARDADVEVRANAGAALAALARSGGELAGVAVDRLSDLLSEDGLLVPLKIVQALAEVPGGLSEEVLAQVSHLARDHPSRLVRKRAIDLLARDRGEGRSEAL